MSKTRTISLAAAGLLMSFAAPAIAQDDEAQGLTLIYAPDRLEEDASTTLLTCEALDPGELSCNPLRGDSSCQTLRPVLCIKDMNLPVPLTLMDRGGWSGGVLAMTSPLKAGDIEDVDAANKICSSTFGDGWRVASFEDGHDGVIQGYGYLGQNAKRLWVDTKLNPDAVCWSR